MGNNENIIFTNETTVEQVVYMHSGKDDALSGRPKLPTVMMYIFVLVVPLILLTATDIGFLWSMVVLVVLSVLTTAIKMKLSVQTAPKRQSVQSTGDMINWHYDFFESYFIADNGGEKEKIGYSQISDVKDTGSAYQIKAVKNYTLKKQGFINGGEGRFVALMKKIGVGMLLKEV